MTKRSPGAAVALVRVPDGSGVRLKSRLRRYSASLRGECRSSAVLRAFGGFTDVFASRAGIGLFRPQNSSRLGPLAYLARDLAFCRFGILLAALDRQQQMPLPRIGPLLLRRARLRRRRFGRVGEAALERLHEVDDFGRRFDLRRRDLAALRLGLDQGTQRVLIAVVEGFWIEAPRAL